MTGISEQLRQTGLLDSEIKVYLYLLENGVSFPPEISEGVEIARPNCYKILQQLIDRGLIQEHKRGKRKIYAAKDPISLVQGLELQMKAITELLPDLRNLQSSLKGKPKIRFYDGFSELKDVWIQSLSANLIQGITSTTELYKLSPAFFNDYHRKLQKKGILLQDIITFDSRGKSTDDTKAVMGAHYETKVLPKTYESIPTDILIWNDNVALMKIEKPVFGTVLTDHHLAETFRILFNFAWGKLPG